MTENLAPVATLAVQGARTPLSDEIDLRALIPNGASIRQPIRYGQDLWDFDGYPFVNQTVHELDFTGIPIRWRNVIKDWTLLRLNPPLAQTGESGLNTHAVMAQAAAADKPLRPMSLVAYALAFATTLTVLEQRQTTQLGPDDWRAFATDMRARFPEAAPQTLAGYVRPLNALWSVRDLLHLPDMFGGRPFGGQTVDSVFKVAPRDLNVDRPEPELCGPLLGLCLWILDNCTDDIFARMERLAAAPDLTTQPREVQIDAVLGELRKWERTGRPVPATVGLRGDAVGPAPSWATFVKLAGASNKDLKNPLGNARKLLEKLVAERGVSTQEDGFNLPLHEVTALDGQRRPWANSLVASRYALGLDHWVCTLAYACAYIVTILTTVRDRELAAIPNDCLREGTYERGDADIPVTRMRGYLVKNRMNPVKATWVVGDDVIKAVQTIHRLKKLLGLQPSIHPQTGEEVLFHPELGRGPTAGTNAQTLQLSGPYLPRFQASAEFLANRGLMPPLPELPDWLAHRTIRITGIEAYASQAWGDALAAAQGHWSSRKVAEGYYGHLPKSVFIADPESVEEVRQITTAQTLLDVASDANATSLGTVIGGAGAKRLDTVLAKESAYELANEPVTGRQLLRIAKNNPNVFVGEFTICVHGPGGLCGNAEEADFRLCRPTACRNSATTPSQRARMELRRRGLVGKGGVFERSRRKIEADAPTLEAEFAQLTDADLREITLQEIPGRFHDAAREGGAA
ncbi:hypothetical protein [Leifsonia sp. C5G2]|uniref:hypothetical protein n=1 Tax=Leifsonia sp. C5G2 TaxID=2735269 RepID=UPI001584EFE2|nr:hypothetical protein [Leifsonia sp. C5G2]NUU06364.1 hypothetical protein [Leifsonia sp. C5G2]